MPNRTDFYKHVLNFIGADIVVYDNQYRYVFINKSAIKDDALREWLIGKTDEDYCRYRNKPLTMAEDRRKIIERARDEKQVIVWEDRVVTKNATVEYHWRNLFPVFDDEGNFEFAIGYGLDDTARVMAQEALKTSQETFASAFDYSGIGMALVSPEGNWLDVNKVLCDLTGYTKEELMELTFHDITYPDDLELDVAHVRKMLRREISTYNMEKRYVSKGGKIVLVSLTVSAVWGSDNVLKFFIAQVVDITQRHELELELKRKNASLEATKSSLINKINQLEELNHIIAHNLRGPAGNIRMMAEALMADRGAKIADTENPFTGLFTDEEGLGIIFESSVSLMNSLSTLMEIAEIQLNKEVPFNDCEVSEIIAEVKQQLHGIIYEKRAEIIEDIAVPVIRYPKAFMENILYNLISNALKYNRPEIPPVITISTTINDGKIRIIVKDNGLGIDLAKYGADVFKLNKVFHEGYDSKGAGLYITRNQVESLGGTIQVFSKVNEGCEFVVTL